jgi:hypothetical protein
MVTKAGYKLIGYPVALQRSYRLVRIKQDVVGSDPSLYEAIILKYRRVTQKNHRKPQKNSPIGIRIGYLPNAS